MIRFFIISFLLIISFVNSFFGQVTNLLDNTDTLMSILKKSSCSDYPEAGIEILYEVGEGNLVPYPPIYNYTYEIAFKVYDVNQIGELSDVVLPKESGCKIVKLKAVAYNLEGNNVVASELEKSDIIVEEYARGLDVLKFSIPNVKDGTVVKYKYLIKDGGVRSGWCFQRKDIPVRYSKFTFTTGINSIITSSLESSVPFKAFSSQKKYEQAKDAALSLVEEGHNNAIVRSWTRRNVPPFIAEPYIGNSFRHLERVSINYNGYSGGGYFFPIVENWEKFNKEKWYDGYFKTAFQKSEAIANIGSEITGSDRLELAKNLYYFFLKYMSRDGFAREPINCWEKKQGNEVSLSKLLCAIYRNKGFESDLVLLANKNSEQLNPLLYNISDITNYVVRIIIDGKAYFLNTSSKDLPFGYLPLSYYNGYARIVNATGEAVNLDPELAVNSNTAQVILAVDEENSTVFKVSFKHRFGVYDAIGIRKEWQMDSAAFRNKYLSGNKEISKQKGMEINSVFMENVDNLEEKLTLSINATLRLDAQTGQLSLDPYFYKPFADNFLGSSQTRKLPIIFDYVSYDAYRFIMKLGKHWEVDELPKAKVSTLGDPPVSRFLQTIAHDEEKNDVYLNLKYENAGLSFEAERAADLKGFYGDAIKTFNQKLVIKRKG